MEVEKKTSAGQVTGIVGIVLAAISLILAFIPCIGMVAVFPAVIAIILGIISIMQASSGYGSKGLGIGTLAVSVASIIVAALWFAVLGGSIILDEALSNSHRIEIFGKKLERAFDDTFDDDNDDGNVTIKIESDSLENTLRELEGSMKSIEINIDNKDGNKKNNSATIIIKTDSVRVKTKQ